MEIHYVFEWMFSSNATQISNQNSTKIQDIKEIGMYLNK